MKWYITLALLVLCSSCTPTEKRTEVPKTQPDKQKVETPKTQPDKQKVETPKTQPDNKKVVTPYLHPDQVLTFNGTFYADKGSKNPKLEVSRYLRTNRAGMRVTQEGASCFIAVSVLQEIPQGSYIKVEFPNPGNPSVPSLGGIDYKSGIKGYKFTSPSTVAGLKIGKDYKIKILVLKTRDSTKPIDVLVQEFRSYLDTTGGGTKAVMLPEYMK
jgi:hypothetical protein